MPRTRDGLAAESFRTLLQCHHGRNEEQCSRVHCVISESLCLFSFCCYLFKFLMKCIVDSGALIKWRWVYAISEEP